jgi:NADH-quinone oxidoreductase subunit L
MGATGKSAQLPLYVWLPDAMEGPTPVSALIHAATMVTAGVYMIARCGTLFVGNAAAMTTIVVIGLVTALLGATIALRQFDLKKVFAYSTISQLGFMFVAVGALAPVAGIFHLVTHAFFKALLFLSSGVVMHAMAGELDMRKFSGLKKRLPTTRWLMLIGCAALAGFPLTSGFFSKDEIAIAAWIRNPLVGGLILLTAFITAYYTFRLYFRVFEGPEILPEAPAHGHGHGAAHAPATNNAHDAEAVHAIEHHHNPEPSIMIAPLVVLAFGALFAGVLAYHHSLANFLGYSPSLKMAYDQAARNRVVTQPIIRPLAFGNHFEQEQIAQADKDLVEHDHRLHLIMMIGSGLIALAGIGLAYQLHLKDRARAEQLAMQYRGATRVLENKYWIDEIYQAAMVEPLRALGRVFYAMDRIVIDGLVWIISFIPQASGFALKLTTQRGYLQGYAVTMLLGIAVILIVVFL